MLSASVVYNLQRFSICELTEYRKCYLIRILGDLGVRMFALSFELRLLKSRLCGDTCTIIYPCTQKTREPST